MSLETSPVDVSTVTQVWVVGLLGGVGQHKLDHLLGTLCGLLQEELHSGSHQLQLHLRASDRVSVITHSWLDRACWAQLAGQQGRDFVVHQPFMPKAQGQDLAAVTRTSSLLGKVS